MQKFSIDDSGIEDFFRSQGYVIFEDLFPAELIRPIQADFFSICENILSTYHIATAESDPAGRAHALFAQGGYLRKNLYSLLQELQCVTALAAATNLKSIMTRMGIRHPVLRNQALRIDFAQEPEFLQGAH